MNASSNFGNEEASESSRKIGYATKKDRSHIILLQGTNRQMYKCNACQKIFRNKKGQCYHDSCITGIKPYKCNICEQSFVKRSHFEYHERVHSGYKPFKCSLCDKAFPQRNKLNRHMISHKLEKEFRCEKCDKRYRKKEDLNNHVTVHTGQRPHVCKTCGKSFGLLKNLNRHARTHSKERPYACELCRKSFKDNSLLVRHKKIHGKERPFSCAHCNRTFLSKSELVRHLVIHSDVKPFSCAYCGTIFRRKDNLDRHIRHHHADNNAQIKSGRPDDKETTIEPVITKSKSSKAKKSLKTTKTLQKCGATASTNVDLTRGNSRDQINSRMDSLGNITPIIRGPGEFSNAVPVINGPIISAKIPILSINDQDTPDASTSRKKKTYTYTEPIPLAEAVTINRRIEEKLYPQNSSLANNYYFFRKNSNTDQQGIAGGNATRKLSVPPLNSVNNRHIDTTRRDNDKTSDQIADSVDNLVPTIRINESSSCFHETISIHHWRRRTAESFRSSRPAD